MNKEVIDYYQSNIKTSRNEDSVYAIKYASQQMLIDKLEQENKELKDQLKTKHEGFMASIDQNCEYATILIELRSWLEAIKTMYENEYKDVNTAEHYNSVLSKLNELENKSAENGKNVQ